MRAESNLGGLLGKASRLLSNRFNNDLKVHNLTVEQWSLLAVLWSKDAQTQKSLQEALLKDKATINSLVTYLAKNAFISKLKDSTDKRSFIISLTNKGKQLQNTTIPIAIQNITKATESVEREDLERTLLVLNQIINNLTKET